MLRLSTAFVRTLRDDPSDAEVPSHRLLLRGSYVRRVGPGIYSWLPLGLRVLRKVEAIVREEMDRIGSQEVLLPALLPREPYERTGRWTEYGDSLFRLQDRRDADYLLGPTHEEIFTLMVKGELGSYNDFPVQLFQIQNKYRDEARPRGGILRGREFLMKDAYSFDLDEAGLQASYDAYRGAYVRIFERLGIEAVPVSATAGAMGGSASEEFLAPCDVGEDTFVRCTTGDYAANVEAVTFPTPASITTVAPEPRRITTPGAKTLDKLLVSLAEVLPDEAFTKAQLLKHVLVVLRHPDGTTEPLAVGIPGDRELDLKRLEAQVAPAEVGLFDRETFEAHPTLVAGFIGPGVLGTTGASGVRYLVDPRVSEGTVWVSGADVVDEHLVDLQVGRDIRPDGTIEAVEVLEGDPCPVCGGTLRIDRGIEVGHVFQLGPKYAEALGLQASGADNSLSTITMGSYGIGISRAVASIVEQHHDERGILWPASVAPYDVHVVIAGKKPEIVEKGEELAASLEAAGLDVLLDDRASGSVGVKLTDAELLGVPVIVVVGRRATEEIAEVRFRADGTVEELAFADVAAAVRRPTA